MERNNEREIINTRVFNAPRERLFAAFTDPKQLAQWWGPNGFTNTIHEFDLRVGGKWRLTMHGPNAANFENESQFTEITRPERIVLQHLEPIHRFQMTMLYGDEAGKTRLTWRMLFDSADEYAKLKGFIADANEQNFDRLQTFLTK